VQCGIPLDRGHPLELLPLRFQEVGQRGFVLGLGFRLGLGLRFGIGFGIACTGDGLISPFRSLLGDQRSAPS